MTPYRRIIVVSATIVVSLGILLYFCLRETGRLKLPSGNHIPQLSLGYGHSLVIAPDGTLWSWGAEELGWPVLGYGQTNGTPAFSPLLRRISSATNWIRVSAGQDHNLALKSDGSIWTWGTNHRGQMGTNAVSGALQSSLVRSVPGNDWKEIEAGSLCSFALKKDGSLWGWGLNNFCQLGIGSTVDSHVPVQIGSATNWTKIRAGGVSAAGIQSDGSLWIWGGSPEFGNSSPGLSNNVAFPRRVTMETNWVDVAVDYNLWLAVKADGTLWAFGKDSRLLPGAPPTAPGMPAQIGTNTDWASVSAGRFADLLRKRDGAFLKLSRAYTNLMTVTQLDLPKDAVGGDIGGGAFAAITLDGEVWAQGAVLGERTSKQRLFETLSKLGIRVSQVSSDKVHRDKPWTIRNIDPGDPPK